MGAWGGKLYQDDDALDLKASLSMLTRIPVCGNDLLKILIENCGGPTDINDAFTSTFWLVIADQFEKKGLRADGVFEKAIDIIENGIDIRNQIERGMDYQSVNVRKKDLEDLYERLKLPRQKKDIQKRKRKPALLVEAGNIYSFPTNLSFHPYFIVGDVDMSSATGWGALIVFDTGRLYDFFPWFCFSLLSVNQDEEPTFESALKARLIGESFTGTRVSYFNLGVPKHSHVKNLPLKLLGSVNINYQKYKKDIDQECSSEAIKFTVINDISFSDAAYNMPKTGELGCLTSGLECGSLLKKYLID